MELTTYLQILARRKWIVIITVLATMAGFFVVQALISPTYEAVAVLRVVPYSSGEPPYAQLVYADRIMNTYVKIATSGPFLDALRQELGLDDDRLGHVAAEIVPDTELIRITVEDSDPNLARDAANALATMVINENPIRDLRITVVDPAMTPEPPSRMRSLLTIILALMVGLIGGIGLAGLIENQDPRLHNVEEIVELTGLDVLGQIPFSRGKLNNRLHDADFAFENAFRRLRINLQKITKRANLKTLMLTSSEPDEGKSTVAANLGISLSEAGCRVLLVDADLCRPSLHEFFDLPNDKGFSDILQNTLPVAETIQISIFSGLDILTSGQVQSDPDELLGQDNLRENLDQLKPDYDYVLVNSPPYLAVADAALIAYVVDGTLLIARRGQVRGQTLKATCEQLFKSDTKMLGLIINNSSPPLSGNYHRYYRKTQTKSLEPTDGKTKVSSVEPASANGK